MTEDFDEDHGLLDDDPTLDYILYEKMEKEGNTSQKKEVAWELSCCFYFRFLQLPFGSSDNNCQGRDLKIAIKNVGIIILTMVWA
jgi:hypothetical protein